MNISPELLAPAGSLESLFAAFQYGADGVYLGVGKLHARSAAYNFTTEELVPLIHYAHTNNKKIYAAFNTLAKTHELDSAFNTLSELEKTKIDAVIIQDLGIYKIIKDYFPKLPLHFSTQMTIHNLEGVKTAEKMGAKRVILARELTLKEIEHIRHNTSIELEIFIHGARCYSYSGLCLFSSLIGGRSGNRGWCAQPCRKIYETSGRHSGHYFSMCDLFTLKDIPTLKNIGIDAFKIEGRLKNPLYVAYASSIYRKAINGEPIDIQEAEKTLKTIYSRETQSFPKLTSGEITTDSSIPRHLGLYIGDVLEAKPDKTEEQTNWITFITREKIEKFDGIAIMEPGKNRSIGGTIREIIVNKKNVFQADPDTKVSIKIPHLGNTGRDSHTDLTLPTGPLRRIEASRQTSGGEISSGVKTGSKIYLSSKSSLLGMYQIKIPKLEQTKTPITLHIDIIDNIIFIACGDFNRSYPVNIEESKTQGFDQTLALKYFSKLGDTPFELKGLNLSARPKIFIQPKELNQIRRDFFKELEEYEQASISQTSSRRKLEYPASIGHETENKRFSIKTDNPDYIETILPEADRLIIEMSDKILNNLNQTLDTLGDPGGHQGLIWSMPPIIRQESMPIYKKNIDHLLSLGYKNFQISNLGGLALFKNKDITLFADYPLYIFNPLSLLALNKLGIEEGTISPELNESELNRIIPIIKNKCDLILYSDLPYFYSANCIWTSIKGKCENKTNCNFDKISFTNKEGDTLIAKNNKCATILINKNAFSWSEHLNHFVELGQKMFRIDFLYRDYAADHIKDIIHQIKAGTKIKNTIEGNYGRKLY